MKDNKTKISVMTTITKMVPAILTALLATAMGFIALYTSPVPMIQDFGKMLTVGMIISFIVGLFLLVPILYTRDTFFTIKISKNKNSKKKSTFFEHTLASLTKKLVRYKWIIIILAITTASLGIWVDLEADVETDVETFMPQDTPALKDIHRLRDIIGSTDQISIVYETENIMDDETIEWVDQISSSLPTAFPSVVMETKSITTVVKQMNDQQLPKGNELSKIVEDMPESQAKLMFNKDETKGIITVGIQHLEASELERFINELDKHLQDQSTDKPLTTITGKAVLDVEMVTALTTGRYHMTLLGMGLVFLALLIIYRHPVKAFIPLLPIILIIGWSGGIMALLDIKYTPLTATLGALIIGVGTEFTILVMERFYEERKRGKSSIDAILIANKKIGTAIFASAFTTIGGFSALLASDFIILSNFGMMTLINISLALLSTIIVMPSILILLDKLVRTKTIGVEQVKEG